MSQTVLVLDETTGKKIEDLGRKVDELIATVKKLTPEHRPPMTINEAAAFLKVKPYKVRELAKIGEAVKVTYLYGERTPRYLIKEATFDDPA